MSTFLCTWPNCGRVFKASGNLNRHKNEVHRKLKPHVCSKCNKAFSRSPYLCDHMVQHRAKQVFHNHYKKKCVSPSASGSSKQSAPANNSDVAVVDDSDGSPGASSDTAGAAVDNEETIADRSRHRCPFRDCDRNFSSHQGLWTHMSNVHLAKERNTPVVAADETIHTRGPAAVNRSGCPSGTEIGSTTSGPHSASMTTNSANDMTASTPLMPNTMETGNAAVQTAPPSHPIASPPSSSAAQQWPSYTSPQFAESGIGMTQQVGPVGAPRHIPTSGNPHVNLNPNYGIPQYVFPQSVTPVGSLPYQQMLPLVTVQGPPANLAAWISAINGGQPATTATIAPWAALTAIQQLQQQQQAILNEAWYFLCSEANTQTAGMTLYSNTNQMVHNNQGHGPGQ